MMNTSQISEPEIYGLFELSDDGTVLYSRTADSSLSEKLRQIVGLNFFDEAAPFENREEFRSYLKRFINSGYPSESFSFPCRKDNRVIPAKIMLVRVTERQSMERAETVIVDIRRA